MLWNYTKGVTKMTYKNTSTVAEIIAELSQLPMDSVVAFPVRWTQPVFNELWEDQLKSPLTNEQWESIAEAYFDNLGKHFWEDSELAMFDVLKDSGLLKEEDEEEL